MKNEINDSSVQLQQSIQKLNELVANLTASFQPITTTAKDIVKPFEGIAHKVPVESIVLSGSRIAEQIQKETQALQTADMYKNITGTLGTLIRTMDLHQYGLYSREIVELIENGKLERVKQGLYRLPIQAERDSEEKLISQLYPDGVLTLMSALYYYGYIDRLPMAWDIAVSRNTSKSRFNIDYPYVQPHYMEDAHLQYAGVSFQLIGHIKDTKTPFTVDLGIDDVVVPGTIKRSIPVQLEGFTEPVISTYSLESTIAEKYEAILQRLEMTSRMKDFYDIYYLSNMFDYDGRVLQQAIWETLQKRGTQYNKDSLQAIGNFVGDAGMQNKWKQYLKAQKLKEPEFDVVVQAMLKFLGPVWDAIVREDEFFGNWQGRNAEWH